jgi:hypothetical protein
MSKHTPGPWKPRRWYEQADMTWEDTDPEPGDPLPPILDIVAANGKVVAAAHDLFKFTEANARLIAAAPDLLEALQNLQTQIRAHHKMNVRKDYSLMVADVVASKAIAKATAEPDPRRENLEDDARDIEQESSKGAKL